jgi:hypothetical protein
MCARCRVRPPIHNSTAKAFLERGAVANRLWAYRCARRLAGQGAWAVPSLNSYWRVNNFRNFADYALTEPFAKGLAQLRELGSEHRCAIMCAEAVWWRRHRRIIAYYLLGEGGRAAPHWGGSCRGGQSEARRCRSRGWNDR